MENIAVNPAFAQLLQAADEALTILAVRGLSDGRVHAARKALKRARGALRLLRFAFSDADYRMENLALRDGGRGLSPLRDARSLIEAIEGVRARTTDQGGMATLAQLEQFARSRLIDARRELSRVIPRRHCIELVTASRARIARPEREHANPLVMRSGLHAIYKKGRKAFARACALPSPETLHEWRKQAKYLHIAASVLDSAGVGRLRKTVNRADRIGDWLGDDHDLTSLRDAAQGNGIILDETLIAAIDKRQAKLRKRAFARGTRLFTRTPKRFLARLVWPVAPEPAAVQAVET